MINQEQREYTVERIKKNKEESKKLEEKANDKVFTLGLSSLLFVVFSVAGVIESNYLVKIAELVVAVFSGGKGASLLKDMVYSLAKKAGLEVMTENLEYALDMASLDSENQVNDNEESKGLGR